MRGIGSSASPGSTQNPDSAGWIEWKGGECHLADHIIVSIERRSGQRLHNKPVGHIHWGDWKGTPDDIVAYRLSDRLADERSASKSPNSSDPSAIAGARERLTADSSTEWAKYAITISVAGSDLRTLLADHARLGGLVDEYALAEAETDRAFKDLDLRISGLEAENARLREGPQSLPECSCVNVDMGSYGAQVSVLTPQGKMVGIDICVLPEVFSLWKRGIETVESCCGHGKAHGYIAVIPVHEVAMVALGYERDPAAPHVFLRNVRALTNREGQDNG